MKVEPVFDDIRTDPRFQGVLHQCVGLANVTNHPPTGCFVPITYEGVALALPLLALVSD
jgi:hypothetical protein